MAPTGAWDEEDQVWINTGAFLLAMGQLRVGLNHMPTAPCCFGGAVVEKTLKFTMSVAYYVPKNVAKSLVSAAETNALRCPDIFMAPFVQYLMFPNIFRDQSAQSQAGTAKWEQGGDLYMSSHMAAKAFSLGHGPPATGAGADAAAEWIKSLRNRG